MPFNFGRGRKPTVSPYRPQPGLGKARVDMMDSLGQVNSTSGMALGRSPMRQDLPGRRIDTSGRAAEMDARMSNVLEARRQAKLSSADPGLSTRGTSPGGRTRPMPGPMGGSGRGLEGKGVRPAPGTRNRPVGGPVGGTQRGLVLQARELAAEFGGGMGMGIPANVNRGSQNIPMTARNYVTPFGDMGMGIPANPVRGSQNIPMLARPSEQSLRVRENVNASRRTREARARAQTRPPLGGSQNRPVAGGVGGAAGAGRTTPGPRGPGPIDEALGSGRRLPKRGRGLLIGAGAAVVAGLAYSGRRGEGSSGGRTSMTRY